jgi:hypothetical protein
VRTSNVNIVKIRIFRIRRIANQNGIRYSDSTSYFKKYSSSKCKQTVCLHYGLDFHFKGRRRMTFAQLFCILPDLSKTENFVDFTQNYWQDCWHLFGLTMFEPSNAMFEPSIFIFLSMWTHRIRCWTSTALFTTCSFKTGGTKLLQKICDLRAHLTIGRWVSFWASSPTPSRGAGKTGESKLSLGESNQGEAQDKIKSHIWF